VKAEVIREMSVEDVRAKDKELREQLFRLRLQKAVGQLDNAVKMRATRRDIARLATILREKEKRA
jgi:large subunit ribosomal protein L29